MSQPLEIRRILAAEAVALAAERHTEDDIDAIAACGQELGEHVDDPVAFARGDLAFMRAVCKAARNVGLELILNTFARLPDEHPELVAELYDDRAATAAMVPAVVDLSGPAMVPRRGRSCALRSRHPTGVVGSPSAARCPPGRQARGGPREGLDARGPSTPMRRTRRTGSEKEKKKR